MVRVGINGFGRIGRIFFRLVFDNPNIEVTAINDLIDVEKLAYLLKYDTAHGRWKSDSIEAEEGALVIDGKKVPVYNKRNPGEIPWAEHETEIVYECTGVFRNYDGYMKHFDQEGVRLVLVSAPADDKIDATLVYGVNNDAYKKGEMKAVSAASCTTNCLAPVVKVLNDKFGIEEGSMTTVHGYTMNQSVLDTAHSKNTRGRAAAANILPTTTGAAAAIGLVIPELNGKLDGMAIRVPIPDGSLVDLSVRLKTEVSAEDVNAAMKEASEGELKGVLGYTEDDLVSSDIIDITEGSMFDANHTKVIEGKWLKCISWYDNEASFINQCIRLIEKLL